MNTSLGIDLSYSDFKFLLKYENYMHFLKLEPRSSSKIHYLIIIVLSLVALPLKTKLIPGARRKQVPLSMAVETVELIHE